MLVGKCVNTIVLTNPHFLAICGATMVLTDVITKKLWLQRRRWTVVRLVAVGMIVAVEL